MEFLFWGCFFFLNKQVHFGSGFSICLSKLYCMDLTCFSYFNQTTLQLLIFKENVAKITRNVFFMCLALISKEQFSLLCKSKSFNLYIKFRIFIQRFILLLYIKDSPSITTCNIVYIQDITSHI